MDEYLETLSQSSLFAGINSQELKAMLPCLSANVREYGKNEAIFLEGDPASRIGVVLSGVIQVVRDDYYGNRSVLALAEPGDLFGEVFVCAGLEKMPVSVFAVQSSNIMLLDCKKVFTVCHSACPFHTKLFSNLLQVVSRKTLLLNQKIQIMSRRTTKEKIMSYLLEQAKQRNTPQFTIPFDRQALADYLGVERSAMSAEIGKLKRSGIIDCKGSFFHIISPLE